MEVQRYPSDFDGIIGGDPATGTPMQVGRVLVYQKMLAKPENFLTADKIELLSKATLAACDKLDGLEDGLITDPRRCTLQARDAEVQRARRSELSQRGAARRSSSRSTTAPR